MSLTVQILIGFIIGLFLALLSVQSSINTKEKQLINTFISLVDLLHIRYLKLKNVLNFLKRHMKDAENEIDKLILLCDEAIECNGDISNINEVLKYENQINSLLENIKLQMENYKSIQEDAEIDAAILAIAESEAYVSDAINIYNTTNLEYNVFIETFPMSLLAWMSNKESVPPFTIATVEDFVNDFVDEDEL